MAAARKSPATACAVLPHGLPRRRTLDAATFIDIETDAGVKALELLGYRDGRYTFCASMGQPGADRQHEFDVDGERVAAVTLRVGNPQCVVLGEVTEERLHTIARTLAVAPALSRRHQRGAGLGRTPNRVRILIWERGVGPTEASGYRRVRGGRGRDRIRTCRS